MINIAVIVIVILAFALAYYLWRYMLMRAMRRVVAIFRETGAVNADGAISLESVGLEPLSFMNRLFRPRDYKQMALQVLGREGAIKMTEGPRFYLDEATLRQSRLSRLIGEDSATGDPRT